MEKQVVPELALYDRNLIPSCSDCNRDRASSFGGDGQRVFHFYDDDVDGIPDVLTAEVVLRKGIPTARFFIPTPTPAGAELYARHFEALKLTTVYRDWATTAMRDAVRETRLATGQASAWPGILTSVADELRRDWGNNEPKVALLRALAVRQDIVALLVS